MTLTGENARPVTIVISGFASSLQVEYGPLMAGTLVSVVPVMLSYLLFQKAFCVRVVG
jgi:ABC-type glycerol-3-phosphate transport system permease component